MTNQYMNNLYRDLLSNSPQTITIDIPADMGTGQILQVVTKQGAVAVSYTHLDVYKRQTVYRVTQRQATKSLYCHLKLPSTQL